jgi:DNA-binding GntR family transcriptional regulator
MLQAVANGDGALAEQKARAHITQTANFIIERLSSL